MALGETPNLDPALSAHGALDWDTQMNGNFSIVDGIFVSGACGDATHALSWSPTLKTLVCQAISGLPNGVANGSALVSRFSQPAVYQSELVVDVRDYGAVCNGSHDDTAALNAAVAVVSGSGWNGSSWGKPTASGKIVLPIGNCTTATGLVYNGGNNYSIEIAGQNSAANTTASTLTYTGTSGGVGILFNSAVRSKIDNLFVSCASCLYAIELDSHNDTESGVPGSHDLDIDGVTASVGSVRNAAAIALGHPGCVGAQVSDSTIRKPYLTGGGTTSTSSGILNLCGNNQKNFTVYDGSIISFGCGINADITDGTFDVDGTTFLNNGIDFVPSGGPAAWHLKGVRSEGSTQFIVSTGADPSSLVVENSYWAGVGPSTDVIISYFGQLTLIGNNFANNRTGTSAPKVVVATPRHDSTITTTPSGVHSQDNWYQQANETTHCVFFDGSGNTLNDKCGSGYYQYFALNTAFTSEGDWGGTTGTLIPLSGSDQLGKDFFGNTFRQIGSTSNYPPRTRCFICMLNSGIILSENNALNGTVNWLSKNSSDVLLVGGSAGATFSGQIASTLSTGTAPFSITSTTPVANLTVSNHPTLEDCGSTTTCAKTQKISALIVRGSVAFPTASTVTVTSLPFTSESTYSCTAADATTAAGIVNATTYRSGSSVTFTETSGVNTDTMRYICVGY